MKLLRLLQRRIIATNLTFVPLLLFGILAALFLNTHARSLKKTGRYLGTELRFASTFSAYKAASGKPGSNTAPPCGERMQQTYYLHVIFSKSETDGSYTVSTTQGLSLSDTDTSRLQSLLQEVAGRNTDTAQTKPSGRPEESEYLTHAFSSYCYVRGRQGGKRVFLATLLDNLSASLPLFAAELSNIFPLAGLLVFGLSFFLARMSLHPVEYASSEQQRFVQGASRELKTPLTVILADLSILKLHPTAIIRKETLWIQNTETEARHMQELTEHLLFLAGADAKNMPPQSEVLSLSTLVESMALPFAALAFERKLSLALDISPTLSVRGDAQTLTQLPATLLDNALEYATPSTEVTVRLCRQGKHASLPVHNNEELTPVDALPRLFDRFFRVDKSRVRAAGGYGLGLSIAKTIMSAHDGDTRADSTAEHGTVFTVALPLSE